MGISLIMVDTEQVQEWTLSSEWVYVNVSSMQMSFIHVLPVLPSLKHTVPPMKEALRVNSIQNPNTELQHIHMWSLCSSWDLGTANNSCYPDKFLQHLV